VQVWRYFGRKLGKGEGRHETENDYRNDRNAGINYAVENQGMETAGTPRYGVVAEKPHFRKGQLAGSHVFLRGFERLDYKPKNRVYSKNRK
jgi:hypothetical protein